MADSPVTTSVPTAVTIESTAIRIIAYHHSHAHGSNWPLPRAARCAFDVDHEEAAPHCTTPLSRRSGHR